MNFVINRVEISTGIKLPYVEQGSPAGIPVLFLHGYTDSWRSFETVLPYLPDNIHAFAITQRGHGEADRPQDGYTMASFATDVAAFMDAVKIETAVIVGHSMGSYITQQFAIQYPERTLGAVLMGSFSTLRGNAAVAEFGAAVATLADPIDPAFAFEFQQSTLAQAVPEGLLEMVSKESLKLPAWVWRAVWQGLVGADFSAELVKILAPTLIVWGDQDSFFPESEQTILANTIPNSELLIYKGAGHALHWEEPARFTADLVAFVNSL
jgi:pimeloyl-ACP methyl ester carboxylesterase